MKKSLIMLFFLFGMLNFLKAQIKVSEYPEGLYITLDDLYNKTPSSNKKIKRVHSWMDTKEIADSVQVNQCYFYDFENDSKIPGREYIAIVHKRELYFSSKGMLNNSFKNDSRVFFKEYPNIYLRAIKVGDFLYLEKNRSSESYNPGTMNGVVGYGLGALLTKDSNLDLLPVLYDSKKREFAIFHKCKFFNKFLINSGFNQYQVNCNDENDNFSSGKVKSFVDQLNKLSVK